MDLESFSYVVNICQIISIEKQETENYELFVNHKDGYVICHRRWSYFQFSLMGWCFENIHSKCIGIDSKVFIEWKYNNVNGEVMLTDKESFWRICIKNHDFVAFYWISSCEWFSLWKTLRKRLLNCNEWKRNKMRNTKRKSKIKCTSTERGNGVWHLSLLCVREYKITFVGMMPKGEW